MACRWSPPPLRSRGRAGRRSALHPVAAGARRRCRPRRAGLSAAPAGQRAATAAASASAVANFPPPGPSVPTNSVSQNRQTALARSTSRPAPQVAAGKAAEHRRPASPGAFALQGVEDLLDGVGHRSDRQRRSLFAPAQHRPATGVCSRSIRSNGELPLGQRRPHPDHRLAGSASSRPARSVQPVVIEFPVHRLEPRFYLTVVDRPAHHLIQRRGEVQANPVAVAVQPAAGIAGRRAAQAQGDFEGLLLPDPVTPPVVVAPGGRGLVDRHPGQWRQSGSAVATARRPAARWWGCPGRAGR